MSNEVQSVTAKKKLFGFKVGTGKDAKVYMRVLVKEEGVDNIYNIPLVTLASIQVFTSKPKVARYAMGSANPIGVSEGVTSVSGVINSHIFTEGLVETVKEKIKHFKPVEARNLELSDDMVVTLEQLEEFLYLDQLPPVDINIFITNPNTGGISSTSVKGVSFKGIEEAIGNGATFMENITFMAQDITPLRYEEVSQEVDA